MAEVLIQSVEVDGDAVYLAGMVDGEPAETRVWKSHLDTLETKTEKMRSCAEELRDMANAGRPKATLDLVGDVTV